MGAPTLRPMLGARGGDEGEVQEISQFQDFQENKNIVNPEIETMYKLTRSKIDKILQTLSIREQRVIRLRYGLDDGHSRTLEEVGKEFNVTLERIRQIEMKALKKL